MNLAVGQLTGRKLQGFAPAFGRADSLVAAWAARQAPHWPVAYRLRWQWLDIPQGDHHGAQVPQRRQEHRHRTG